MSEQIVNVTEKALNKIRSISKTDKQNETDGLRLAVMGGGCSGFSYKIEFSAPKDSDNVIEFNDIKIFIDPKSSIYLNGTTLDFKDGLEGKGFVFENPNAKNTCGCGESFSI